VRQLNDESKPVHKVGFVREKGKVTARELQQSLEAGGSLHGEGWGFYGLFNSGLGGFFSLAMDSWLSGELVWFTPLLREGDNLESILLISPVADLFLSFRMQECRPPSPQDVGMLVPSMGDGIPPHLP
jgi:hypothetical protein